MVGSPYHGRDAAGTELLIGYFVNMLTLRLEVARASSMASVMHGVRDAAAGGMRHAALPFQQIVRDVEARQVQEVEWNVSKFDTSLHAATTLNGSIGGAIEFSTALFRRCTIDRLVVRFHLFAARFADTHLNASVHALPLMPADDFEIILWSFNETKTESPLDTCVHDLIAAQTSRTPTAVAVDWQGDTMTFAELSNAAS